MSTEKARRSPSALIRYLSERWPGAFDAKAPKPLKIGIRDDIRAVDDDLSDEELSRALRVYARTGTYLAHTARWCEAGRSRWQSLRGSI
ncbi:ProQ/FINO family protein [Sinorhizobium fredii]